MRFLKTICNLLFVWICYVLYFITNLMYLVAAFARVFAAIILLGGFSLFMMAMESDIESNLRSPYFILIILVLTAILVSMKPLVEKLRKHIIRVMQKAKEEIRD